MDLTLIEDGASDQTFAFIAALYALLSVAGFLGVQPKRWAIALSLATVTIGAWCLSDLPVSDVVSRWCHAGAIVANVAGTLVGWLCTPLQPVRRTPHFRWVLINPP